MLGHAMVAPAVRRRARLRDPKNVFDIHGGGIDLVFPHHENEIAQSCCAFGDARTRMANVWMHNGFLQVEGEKMSKSLGNFVTIRSCSTELARPLVAGRCAALCDDADALPFADRLVTGGM